MTNMALLRYHKDSLKPQSKEGFKGFVYCNDKYLEGENLYRFSPFDAKKMSPQCTQHCWDTTTDHESSSEYDCSNKKHTTAEYRYTQYRVSKTPKPRGGVSAALTKGKDLKIPCDLYEGTLVQVYSKRENLAQHNGRIGTVAGVIYSRDRSRSIIYVNLSGIKPQPTFWYSELKAVVAPQAVEEVQRCQ